MTALHPIQIGKPRALPIVAIAASSIIASGFLGGSTNAINGAISPYYFVTVLRWYEIENVWRASIAQGVFEGLLLGVLFSLVFTIGTVVITSGQCSFGFALKHLMGIVIATYACWGFGGLAGIGLSILSAEFYRNTFVGVPNKFEAMIRFAWVGGSIWGAEIGGLVSTLMGLVVLRADWRHSNLNRENKEPGKTADRYVAESLAVTPDRLT